MKHALLYQCRYLSICLKIFTLPYRQHSGTLFSQLVRIMKITGIIIMAACLHVSAALYSQKVTLNERNSKLSEVFVRLREQTGYNFVYNNKLLKKAAPVTVRTANEQLEEALREIFKDQPLTFSIIEKTIVVKEKERTLLESVGAAMRESVQALLPDGPVRGTVTDENGDPLPGVTVILQVPNAAAKSVASSADGKYMFSAVPSGSVLIFNMIGFKRQEIQVSGRTVINVKLNPDVKELQNVVITGYQSIKKDTYTGNAIVVKGEDLKRNNPQNVLKAIQSFDPSFKLLENNLAGADPNALPKINVRGATALPSITDDILDRNNLSSSYNLPAFILDGFEVSLQKVVDLDINRIESVTLLKDGAATAVYGSRAANGVMVITTKAPVPGKLQLNYNYELTFNGPDLSDYHVLNAKDKIAYEQLAGLYKTGGESGNTTQEQLEAQLFTRLRNVASGVNTYWLSQPLRNAYQQKHSAYVQGGDKSFRYGIDLRYQTQPGVMKGSENNRYSGGVNFTYTPGRNLLLKNEVTITQVDKASSPYGDFSTYVRANPYFPIRDSSGALVQELARWSVNRGYTDETYGQYYDVVVFNPLYDASLSSFDKSAYTEIINAFSADYRLSNSFRIKGLVSLNKNTLTADQYISPYNSRYYFTAADKLNNRGDYKYQNDGRLGIDGNVTLNYNRQIGVHSLNFVLGANILSSRSDLKVVEAQGFSNDEMTNISFARIYKEDSHPQGSVLKSRTAGAFFSGNYAFKDKYLMDASMRIDGASSFGSDKRFAPFWSLGLGWNIHRESFMQNLPFISQLRLKGSIATVGSVSFQPFQARSLYEYNTSNWYSTGIGATIKGYGNTNLEWQKTKTTDGGVDLGLFKDRVVISPRYYYKLTQGLITDINIAPSTGFATYKDNLGDMSNRGYELYLQANVLRTRDFNVNLNGNLSHNTNKIVKISNSLKDFNNTIDNFQTNRDNGAFTTPLLRYLEGQSLYTIYAVKSLGIDPQNGREILVKKDGSLTYDWDVKDIQPVGNTTPDAEGFFGSSITYKGFLVSFSFHYRFGGEAFNQTLIDRVENADPRFNVDSRVLSDRWVKPGDHTFFKNIADLNDTYVSSRFVQKDNLLELQSVYLSYDFKREWIKKARLQNLRAAITANDIFRSSSIEIERGINYPFARSFTFSLQAAF